MIQLNNYLVTWQIDVEAANPRAAAEEALRIQRSYGNTANVFDVQAKDQDPSEATRIDLAISAHEAAKHILIVACTRDMVNTLINDAAQRAEFVTKGFKGFADMYSRELVDAAVQADLGADDEQVRWAIELLS
jgi:hypothetical protein